MQNIPVNLHFYWADLYKYTYLWMLCQGEFFTPTLNKKKKGLVSFSVKMQHLENDFLLR